MSDTIEMFKDNLVAAFSRLREINRKLLKEDGGGALHSELLKEQQNIMLVQIPSLNAKIRRMGEIVGDLQEESAKFSPIFTTVGDKVFCNSHSYLLGGDIFWNINPRIVGVGKDNRTAAVDFCAKIRHIMDRRHGRPVRMIAQTATDFREAICAHG
jgi:hypothetical protein